MGRIKKNKETTENAENAEKQIDFFRDFCSCQKLIVVERLFWKCLPVVCSADVSDVATDWVCVTMKFMKEHEEKAVAVSSTKYYVNGLTPMFQILVSHSE